MSSKLKILLLIASSTLVLFSVSNIYLAYQKTLFNYVLSTDSGTGTSTLVNEPMYKSLLTCDTETGLQKCILGIYTKTPKTNKNIEILYSFLNDLRKKNSLDSASCHILSHEIGKLSFNASTKLNDIYTFNLNEYITDDNCATGFYHGQVIKAQSLYSEKEYTEVFSTLVTYLYEKYQTETDVVKKSSWLDNIHGIGHTAYVRYSDIQKSLDFCNALSENSDIRDLCFSGVFMEHSFTLRNVGIEVEIKDCAKYDFKYQFSCLVATRNDPSFVREHSTEYLNTCNTFNGEEKKACVLNFIYQDVMNSDTELNLIKENCSTVSNELYNFCLANYARYHNQSIDRNYRKKNSQAICSLSSNIFSYFSCLNNPFLNKQGYFMQRAFVK